MTPEEIAKRFCKFELCTHRNGEGMCCLFNQDNCIFHRLEKENKTLEGCLLAEQELTQTLEKEKCELLGIIQEKDKAIKKLIGDMAGLEEDLLGEMQDVNFGVSN